MQMEMPKNIGKRNKNAKNALKMQKRMQEQRTIERALY